MYCIRCGGIIHLDILSCFHCGASINHNGNIHTVSWGTREQVTGKQERRIPLFSNKTPMSSIAKLAIWTSLIIPALLLPYIFELSFKKYHNADSILLDGILSLIVLSVFYFTKKAL